MKIKQISSTYEFRKESIARKLGLENEGELKSIRKIGNWVYVEMEQIRGVSQND